MKVATLFKRSVPPQQLFSMDALRRAWNQVRRGGKSPGTDKVTLELFDENLDVELNRLRQQLMSETYTPHPVRQFYIKKASGKLRPIRVWTVRDRIIQRVIVDYMTPILEHNFLDCSYGFRPGKSVKSAVEAIITGRDANQLWVLDADISDCFNTIDLKLLMREVKRTMPVQVVIKLIEQWLYTPIEGQAHTVAGVSQGGVVSPSLANLYLHRFDEMLIASLPQSKLVRFADDFIILSADEDQAIWSLEVARRSLANLKLKLNMRKTQIVHFDEGFNFLGYHFLGNTAEKG